MLFFGFILLAIFDSWRIYRRLWVPGEWPQQRLVLEALAIVVGLLTMLVASIFLNRMRWELWWVFGGYVLCLKNVVDSSDQNTDH
jgi:hypothetical protein